MAYAYNTPPEPAPSRDIYLVNSDSLILSRMIDLYGLPYVLAQTGLLSGSERFHSALCDFVSRHC